MDTNKLTYKILVEKINKKQPVSFSRFGDGEWNCMLGSKNQANCDNHIYYYDLGIALKKVLIEKPKYFVGMQNLAMRVKGEQIEKFKDEYNLSDLAWFNADILHHASIKGQIKPFFDAINTRDNVVLVGPGYLDNLEKYFKFTGHLVIPELNCWLDYKKISYACSKIANRLTQRQQDIVFLISASMPAKVLIHDIFNQYNDSTNISLLDMGSVFDPFAGRNTRGYHRDLDLVKLNGF